jgi:hypothetical protein
MKRFQKLCLLLFILMLPTTAMASSNALLELWKRSEFLYGKCGHCADLVSIKNNKDWSDFLPYNLTTRDGYFTANLNGPAGTSVTLYGQEGYRKNRGYLIIIKKDASMIEIENMEAFTPGKWTEVDKDKGAYSVFYQPYQNFKTLVSSVKWGKWWDGATPVSKN